jgi:hypothetical protein
MADDEQIGRDVPATILVASAEFCGRSLEDVISHQTEKKVSNGEPHKGLKVMSRLVKENSCFGVTRSSRMAGNIRQRIRSHSF